MYIFLYGFCFCFFFYNVWLFFFFIEWANLDYNFLDLSLLVVQVLFNIGMIFSCYLCLRIGETQGSYLLEAVKVNKNICEVLKFLRFVGILFAYT